MAIVSNTYQTYDAIGNREDLIDIITVISPDDTPVLSMTASTRATATLHEWQTDALTAPSLNAQIEGDDGGYAAITATTRVTNNTQISRKAFLISETQEVVAKGGRSSEASYQTALKLRELATDIEFTLVHNSSTSAASSAGTRIAKGIRGFVTTNTSTGASGGRAFTATILDTLLGDCWAAGGNPDTLLMGSFQKKGMANSTNFPGNSREVSAERGILATSVDVYKGSFGIQRVVLSHVMNSNNAGQVFALEMRRWRKAWLRPIKRKELAATGDARKFLITAEYTLESLAENANGVVKNLTTS